VSVGDGVAVVGCRAVLPAGTVGRVVSVHRAGRPRGANARIDAMKSVRWRHGGHFVCIVCVRVCVGCGAAVFACVHVCVAL
jgi:hypothetical protein